MSGNKTTDDISDEMLKLYLAASDIETPDLWNRVEQGFEQEIANINHGNYDNRAVSMDNVKNSAGRKKKFVRRRYAGLAAAVLICLIAVPVIALLRRENRQKGDVEMDFYSMDEETAGETDSGKYQDAEESTAASMEESDAADAAAAFDSETNTDNMETDTADSDDAAENVQADTNTGTIGKNSAVLEVQVLIKEETTADGTIILVAEIQAVESNEGYGVVVGDILEFDNAAYVEECADAYDIGQDGGGLSAVITVSDVVEQSDGRYMCHYLSGM